MRRLTFGLIVLSALWPIFSSGAYTITESAIDTHIRVLASDSLEGREVGEPGEWKAAQYIIGQFQAAGLQPAGENGFLQSFEFTKKIDFGPKNRLVVNGTPLAINEEYLPLSQSANTSFSFDQVIPVDYGITTEDSSYNDYGGKDVAGKAVLIKRFTPDAGANPHVDFSKYESLTDKILNAVNHRAAGVFIVTPSDKDDTLINLGVTHVTPKDIPIVMLRRKGLAKLGIDSVALGSFRADGEVELVRVHDTGYNVIGTIPGTSDTTIIIGAHYDHLGWGGPSSRYTEKEKAIHHGADDNGSGDAGLLELARYFADKRSSLKYTFTFVAFSGEEAGILGSSAFVKHAGFNPKLVRMMLNMDMIGRLKDQENGLAVFGTGTAAEFKAYFDSLKVDNMKITFREPGTGPSDHTAFYNSEIPVLHFFTGAHDDYHKPSDTPEKIDLTGVKNVAMLVADIATHFDQFPAHMTFQKTVDPDAGKRRSAYSVTLGIMPDYVAEVKGVKVDGVSPDRPGERAGILKGDVIVKMGQYTIDDIYAYMSALGKFRKGDTTTVVVQRGADSVDLKVEFK